MRLSGDTCSLLDLYTLVGAAKMTEMVLLGTKLYGTDCEKLGIAYLAEEGELEKVTNELAAKLAKLPGYAVKRIKLNLLNTIYADLPKLAYLEADAMWDCSRTQDFAEAVDAFIEKRGPVFVGK